MPTILVLADDSGAREDLAEILRRLFPQARVIAAGVDARPDAVEGGAAPIVLADVATLERVRRWTPLNARVVALTREMGPDTLLRAEALGVDGSLRLPARAGHLQAVLERMVEGSASRGAAGEASPSDARDPSWGEGR